MLDRAHKEVPSPPKAARVEDGKIRKPKGPNKSESQAIQHFNGKTYACESCKRGHRVNKCDHGRIRPISETNQPGRPSGGQKRGCQCPRNCACTTKSCKCDRDCACTQEMFLIVRLDNPAIINREATSTPKPIWEDANGHKLTLKKVWADANGKQIDIEEYQERKRRMKEREAGFDSSPENPNSSCCGSKRPKEEESESSPPPATGCRHRQNLAAEQPSAEGLKAHSAQQASNSASNSWGSACSCGSGCSCLYCPEHPNNATSINHTQQQVKHLAEQAFSGDPGATSVSLMPESDGMSCMGGRPTFFLSRTPGISQQQLQQFFPDDLDPNAIYLTYPIQQHSWTNQPVTAHCSRVHSPSGMMAMTPDPSDPFTDTLNDLAPKSTPWDLLPDDANGTWNFSDGQLGDSSFSWTDFDATRGTDYSIGQATVASLPGEQAFSILQSTTGQQTPSNIVQLDPMTSPPPLINGFQQLDNSGFPNVSPQFDAQSEFINFDMASQGTACQNVPGMGTRYPDHSIYPSQTLNAFGVTSLPPFDGPQAQIFQQGTFPTKDLHHIDSAAVWDEYAAQGGSRPAQSSIQNNSPITNHV